MQRPYKCLLLSNVLALAIFCHAGSAYAATFTYHGSLQDTGKPAEGNYDLELTLYSAPVGSSAIGGPLELYNVPAHGGSFSVEADFGPLSKIGGEAWLGVKVRNAGKGEFAALSTRSLVSPDATSSVCPGAWTLDGNAGTLPGTGIGQNYLGTADNQPLVIAVNGAQAGKLASSTDGAHPDSVNVVLGSPGNFVGNNIGGATVGGGGSAALVNCGPSANLPCVNSAVAAFSTVAGGYFNSSSGDTSAIGGGALNAASGSYSTIGGGIGSAASGNYGVVAGGAYNFAFGSYATVGGGFNNFASGDHAVVGGGFFNVATSAPGLAYATVSGGNNNTASGGDATVSGGNTNTASGGGAVVGGGTNDMATGGGSVVSGGDTNIASGVFSSVAGGNANTASGFAAMVAGGQNNQAGGDLSFAGGFQAHVRNATEAANTQGDNGTFMWADDSVPSAFTSSGPNQFLVRAMGGAGINGVPVNPNIELTIVGNGGAGNYSNVFLRQSGAAAGVLFSAGEATGSNNNAAFYVDQYNGTTQTRRLAIAANGFVALNGANATQPLVVGTNGSTGNGAFLSAGGAWTSGSSRTFKENFTPVDVDGVLAKVIELPVQTWFYKDDHQEGRHLGPMAEDFAALFGLGNDDKHIAGVDESGVAFAAIQGLNQKLEKDNAQLRSKLDDVLARLNKLESGKGE